MKSQKDKDAVDAFVSDFYDKNASTYFEYRLKGLRHDEDALVPPLKDAIKFFGKNPLKVLDIGCGFEPGICCVDVPCESYTGVDLSGSMLNQHTLRGTSNAILIKGDIRSLDFKRFSYNFVIGSLVLNYVQKPEEVLSKVRRNNSGFFIALPNPLYDKRYGSVLEDGTVILSSRGLHFRYYHHSIDLICRALFPVSTFEIVFSNPPMNDVPPVYVCFYGVW